MDSLNGFVVFVQVAETRSFVAAGRLLGVSASAVGKSVARPEEKLGVRLFHRSTRNITLTAEGTLFLDRCRRILAEIEAAELDLQANGTPRGRLRVSLSLVSSLVLSVLSEFMHTYPEIELDLDFTDQIVNVIEEGFDAVVRTGEPHDSRLTARRLGAFRSLLVASPDYLTRGHTAGACRPAATPLPALSLSPQRQAGALGVAARSRRATVATAYGDDLQQHRDARVLRTARVGYRLSARLLYSRSAGRWPITAHSSRLCGAHRRFSRAVAREQTSVAEGTRTGRFSVRAGVSRFVSLRLDI